MSAMNSGRCMDKLSMTHDAHTFTKKENQRSGGVGKSGTKHLSKSEYGVTSRVKRNADVIIALMADTNDDERRERSSESRNLREKRAKSEHGKWMDGLYDYSIRHRTTMNSGSNLDQTHPTMRVSLFLQTPESFLYLEVNGTPCHA